MWRNHWVIINLHIFESKFFFRSLTILLLNLWFPWSFVRVCFALNKIFTIPLDFRDHIIKTSLAFNHLVVATTSQCYIYRLVALEWCGVLIIINELRSSLYMLIFITDLTYLLFISQCQKLEHTNDIWPQEWKYHPYCSDRKVSNETFSFFPLIINFCV